MATPIEQLKDVEINAELSQEEITAIDKIKLLNETDKATFLESLKTGTINIGGKQMTMNEVITAFNTQVVWDSATNTFKAVGGKTPDDRVNTLISDNDQSNDLVWLISTIDFLSNEELGITSAVNISLKTYFKELQSTLGTSTKSETTTTDKTAETSTLDLSKVGTLYFVDGTKADKLKTTIDGYTRKNNEIKKQVYEYLNAGKISALQEYVYKQNAANGTKDTMNSRYNKRDGYLGPKTLTGIKNVAAIDTPMDISKIDNPATITYTPVKNKTETVNVMKITKDIVLQNEPELYNLKINAAEDDREPMSGYTRVNHDADPTDYSVILKTIADSPESYHLDFKNGNYQPAEGYQRIDETDLTNYWVISNEIVAAPATYNLIPNANGGYEPATGYKREKPDDPIDFTVVKETGTTTPTTTTPTETKTTVDSSKEIESKLYNELTDDIEKIKTSEFVALYKAKYAGIDKYFSTTLFVTKSESNPYFQLKYTNPAYPNAITSTDNISLRECVDVNGNIDKTKLFEKIRTFLKPKTEANEKADKQKKLEKAVRGLTFSKADLFGTKYDGNKFYDQYFEEFDNSLIKVDSDAEYTHVDGDYLHFDLDESGSGDNEWSQNHVVAVKDITDANGAYDKAKFKELIASAVEKIVKENYMIAV